MKTAVLIIGIISMAHLAVCADVSLGGKLTSTHEDPDYTIQPLPVTGINEDTIVLWNGDDILGYFKNIYDTTPMAHAEYCKGFLKGLENAVKDFSMKQRKDFDAPEGLEMSSFRVQYFANEETVYQVIYITTTKDGHYANAFTCVEPKQFDSIISRVDKIMQAATLE